MIKVSLIFLALFSSNYFLSQKSEEKTINEWLTENNFIDNNDYLYHTSIRKSTNKMGDSEIEALIKTEKELSNKSLKNMIYENSKELSFIDFNNLEKYYSYTDRKTIQVVCVINKKTVSDYWVKDIERKLENLKSSLSESQITGQLTSSKIEEMLNNTKVIRKEIDRYEQIAFKLNPKMDMSIINLFKTDIDGRINDLNSRMDKTVFNEKLSSARRKINNQDYIGSYIAYKDLQLEYPNNTDVIYGIDEAFNSLIKNYDQRLSQYELNENFDAAIKTLDSIVKLDVELLKKYSTKLNELRKRKFNLLINKIEKLIEYKTISGEQLKNYMSQLNDLKDVDPNKFYKLKASTDKRLLDYEMKMIKSDIYNKNYTKALKEIPILKSSYDRSRKIESFERGIDRKIYKQLKNDLLENRPRLYNIEQSVFLMSPAKNINNYLSNNYNLNLNYSIGIYRRLNIKPKSKLGKFKYSTIGIKFDYLDSKQTFNNNDSLIYERNNTFINYQLSFGIRKFIFIDLGYLSFINNSNSNLYSGSLSFYIPFGYVSFGLNAKYLTDFKENYNLMTGVGIKFNFGLKKKFNSNDKNEIETSILKLKQ